MNELKDEDNNSCKFWYEKAYRNTVTDKDWQGEIFKEIELIKIYAGGQAIEGRDSRRIKH